LDTLDRLAKKQNIKWLSEKTGVPIQYIEPFDHPLKAEGAAIALMPFVGKDADKEPEPAVQCVKCGTTIEPTIMKFVKEIDHPFNEHLEVKCCICGYVWNRPTWESEHPILTVGPTKAPPTPPYEAKRSEDDIKRSAADRFNDILDGMLKDSLYGRQPAPKPQRTLWNAPIMTHRDDDLAEDCCCCEDTECPDNPGFTGQ
jgi:hypothetical protein